MKVELRTITPQMAKAMLEKNTHNRPANKKHVSVLANQIKKGLWKVNGDTICMNCSRLIDGQKRLMAVIEADMPITTLVVEGVADDVFDTKDIGQRRSQADTLACEGQVNSKELAACLGYIERYYTGQTMERRSYNNTEILELLAKYPKASESIKQCHNKKRIISKAVLAACHFLFEQLDHEKANWFVATLISGQGLTEGMPLYLLRERLMRNALSKAKLSNPYIMALVIKSWNHERQGRTMKYLRFREDGDSPEAFPVVH